MEENNEQGPAPIMPTLPGDEEEYSGSMFFCFQIEKSIENKGVFQIESSYIDTLSHETKKINEFTILRVFFSGLINKLITRYLYSQRSFKIIYKVENDIYFSSNDFIIKESEINFIYNIAKQSNLKSKQILNPKSVEQYEAFNKILKNNEILFNETLKYLNEILDMELYLHLLELKQNKITELFDLLNTFPNMKMKIIYNKKNLFPKINLEAFSKNKNYMKLIIIYSVIQDSTNLLNELKEDDLNIILRYNDLHKDSPLTFKEKIFKLFISKTNKIDNIKKICQYCESIPLVFSYLLDIGTDKLKEIKNLTINDLPRLSYVEDNLLELIDNYEKIKAIFKENNITILWRNYLYHLYQIKSIDNLEKIKEKFIEINKEFYKDIIEEMNIEIIKKGKMILNEKKASNLEMFKFINKYNSIDDFYSDINLLKLIGNNINLKDFEKEETIKEFNQCKFLYKINEEKIKYYITGILDKINNFEDFFLFFKYIYLIKELESGEQLTYEKEKIISSIITKYFISLLNRLPQIKITNEFKEIFKKVIIISIKINNYLSLIQNNYMPFNNDQLFSLLIEIFINNSEIKKYILDSKKNEISKEIINHFYQKNLNIEKKIDFLLTIESLNLKEHIMNTFLELDLDFEIFLNEEKTISFIYLSNFIKKKIYENKEIIKSNYYQNLKSNCLIIQEKLKEKEINFKELYKINELQTKNILSERLYCIFFGDSQKSLQMEKSIKEYKEKYIKYYNQLDNLIQYYNYYFPKTKKDKIDEYKKIQEDFNNENTKISNIKIENIDDEVQNFDTYDSFKFFKIFYKNDNSNNENIINDEENIENQKFKNAIETLNKCDKLLKKDNIELSFLEKALNQLEEKEILKEIINLKNHFDYKNANENQILKELMFYKNRKKINIALKSLKNVVSIFAVEDKNDFDTKLDKLFNDIENLKNLNEINDIIQRLDSIDNNILEKNFCELLEYLYQKDELINFLILQKEAEARNLIDGLFDSDNEKDLFVELNDIEAFIKVVCFINELKNNTKNIKLFLNNFHEILDKKNEIYKEIASNIEHINNIISELKDFIKIQLGKHYKFSANIENFIQKGIIEFKKSKYEAKSIFPDQKAKEKYLYDVFIKIDDKEMKFNEFTETINKIKVKNIYKYGKYKDYFLKSKKIAELISQILFELDINPNQEFNKIYKVSNFKFIEKGSLKLPELENELIELRKKNYQKKNMALKLFGNNPLFNIIFNISNSNLYDLDEKKFKQKIENYFPNIKDVEEKEIRAKGIHKRYICDGCGMNPLIGIRYHCLDCQNFDYCENCMEKYKDKHKHKFEKFEKPVDNYEIPSLIKLLYIFSEIKIELTYLKGIFFYKTSLKNYELDILKFRNTLFKKEINQDNSFFLPPWNCLLCYDDLKEDEIYSFVAKAISCETNNLFMIIRPEELEIANERHLINTIKEFLSKKNYKINSCIIVLYINQNAYIIKQLKNIREKYELPEEPPLFKTIENSKIENLYDLPVEVVTSDNPRVGKTTHILEQLKKDEEIMQIILGDIDQRFLIHKMDHLDELKKKPKPILILLELYENPNEKTYNLIRNFLFQFLILKMYKSFSYFEGKIRIFIEISSDYTTFKEDFKILDLFKRYDIKLENNPDFYEKNKLNLHTKDLTNLLNVLNYLNLLKNGEINRCKISFDSIFNSLLSPNNLSQDYFSLIKEYFIKNFPSKNLLPNYGQIKMFGDLLGDLIYNLDKCSLMDPVNLAKSQNSIPILKTIREKILLSYIKFVTKFSSINYESILLNQKVAAENQKKLEYELSTEEKTDLIKKLNDSKNQILYSQIDPALILFNNIPKNDQYKKICSILISKQKNQDHYFEELNQFLTDYLGSEHQLLYLHKFAEYHIFLDLTSIFLTPNTNTTKVKENLIKDNYEFTIDNFIKMILIYLRIRANIPIILLGETGCGKTSLIKAIAHFLEDRYRLIKFDIHSGLTYDDIFEKFIKEDLMLKLADINKVNENEKKIILFLDEINTTNCLNLLCDIFTKNSFLGYALRRNVYIIAACNPYRLLLSNNEEIGYRNKKLHKVRNLAYTVNPLPLCLINYVFDFGNLSDENEEVYIKKFVHSTLDNRFSKGNNNNYSYILDLVVKAIHECQSFIRTNSEISSVSLREIERFTKFFDFFYKITKERKEFNEEDFSFLKDKSIFKNAGDIKYKKENVIILKTTNLCLFMCYYLRIINPEKRKLLAEKMSEKLRFEFLDYPIKLQNKLVDNIILDKGIAKNRALLDNLFSLFVCLNNKIPVFICGKAGCSKTLSFNLLFESMKGKYSKSKLFQKYPSLYVTSYQGSLTSNSEEIKKIFENAQKIYDAKKDNNIKFLSVILFDEMGLAEISPNNPLKIIHSQFDRNKEQEIAFVGISNWALDASKMNRGVHLSVLEPDLDDLKLTASTISNDIYEEINNNTSYKKMIENLSESYYKYKQYLKKNQLSNYDFHGSRDFYYLIKIASKLLKNNDKSRTLENIALESIERNFGGLESESREFKKIYYGIINKKEDIFIDKCDIFSCIKNNLEEENNRYLLLITNKTKSDTLIEYILKDINKKYIFIQGSKLKEDQNENYVLEKAWSIISSMEKGEIIILKDIEIIYPKFYDLFNKNFQKFGNAQYSRVVLDSTKNERHIVDKNFRCIILLERKDVDEQDPPFLNRFEKHLMSFEYLLNEHQKEIAKELYEEIIDLTTIQDNNDEDIKNKKLPLLVNINKEEINYLVLDLSKKSKNLENNIGSIYELLIPTFTQENFISAMLSSNKKNINNYEILKYYEKNSHTSIFKFLKELEKNKVIVYTFSPYYKDIFTEKSDIQIENEKFGILSKENTVEIIFNDKLSEKMINYFFILFYEQVSCNLFIVHFRVKDTKFLKYFKFQLDLFHKKTPENPKKIFLFIIHIEKNKDTKKNNEKLKDLSIEYLQRYQSYFFSFLSDYQQITIDNLLEQRNISITNLYNKRNEEL